MLAVAKIMYFVAENRKILHEQEAEKMLIHLLSHESNDVQTAAAQALGVMSENLLSKDSIREWGKSRQCGPTWFVKCRVVFVVV